MVQSDEGVRSMIFLIGIILMIIAFAIGNTTVGAVGVIAAVVGFIMLALSASSKDTHARQARREYWANGTEPAWKTEQRARMEDSRFVSARFVGRDGSHGLENGQIYTIEIVDNRRNSNENWNYRVKVNGNSLPYRTKAGIEKEWCIDQ